MLKITTEEIKNRPFQNINYNKFLTPKKCKYRYAKNESKFKSY